jgi:dihydrodipicolinate synthase/N-acetylneuraminate lyase
VRPIVFAGVNAGVLLQKIQRKIQGYRHICKDRRKADAKIGDNGNTGRRRDGIFWATFRHGDAGNLMRIHHIASRVQPNRKITGMSAVLLPFRPSGAIDWPSMADHIRRTADAGLTPAVNMDTGYAAFLDDGTRNQVLDIARTVMSGRPFVAGVVVSDTPEAAFDRDSYRRQAEVVQQHGGLPIIFQSYGLAHQPDQSVIENYSEIGRSCDSFLAFELGTMFAEFGRIYPLELYGEIMKIPKCIGAKHSSLNRQREWDRLELRDKLRPEFRVLSGNDLAIDMVMYGSDYLLGLSTFCPDLFARRDAMWENGDAGFYELNDVLQFLGFLAFREPVSAYKHNAAMFLNQRGWIASDLTHPESKRRPQSDRAILAGIGKRLGLAMTP